MELDSKLGVKDRVFQLRIIRPYNNESIEKEFKELKEQYNEKIKEIKEKSQKGVIAKDLSKKSIEKIKKQRKRAVKEFFNKKAKENPDILTLPQVFEGFRLFSRATRDMYNTTITESYIQLKKMKENGVKPDHYGNVSKAFEEISKNRDTRVPYANKLPEKIPSNLIQGIAKVIQSNFRGKELLRGDRSLSIARTGFPIPFYLAQGGQTEKDSLIKFYEVSEDEYIAEFNAPVVINGKIIIKKIKVLCSTRKRKKNFRRNKDDATNKLIMDFITGEIKNVVKKRLDILSPKHDLKQSKIEELLRKYTQIPRYEIIPKPTKFGGSDEWFLSITCKILPEKIEKATNPNIIAGIDYCYSKDKIMQIAVIDVQKYKEDKNKINSWQIASFTITDYKYGLRKIYDDFYSERRKMQAMISRRIKSDDYEHKFNLRFQNRRNYIIKVIVKHISNFMQKHNVSEIYFENLDNLSKKEDWFTVHKIRGFPRKELINLLAMKLVGKMPESKKKYVFGNGVKIDLGISPAYTSQKCSICRKRNEKFDFKFRSANNFPPFTCIDSTCKFGKDLSKAKDFEKFIRDADLNAARNIALRGSEKA